MVMKYFKKEVKLELVLGRLVKLIQRGGKQKIKRKKTSKKMGRPGCTWQNQKIISLPGWRSEL